MGTYSALRAVFQERSRAVSWIKVSDDAFGGAAASDIMLAEGLGGLVGVRRYLEAELGAW